MGGASGADQAVEVDGRQLKLSNLDKVLYPAGTTKAEVIDYYARIADVLLPHLTDRPLTVVRFPEGVGADGFFSKNAPAHRPAWVTTQTLPSPGSTKNRRTIDYLVAEERPTLVWLANLAALEMHTPMWRISTRKPDLLVADLDPGPGTNVLDCARVALLLREVLPEPLCVKTSGSKGLQVYGRVDDGRDSMRVRDDMRTVAERLARDHPDLVVSNMRKDLRHGRVLLDWSQNNPAKTTVSVYSLRARASPTVSTPVSWDEVAAARDPRDLAFTATQVLDRVARHGDLFAPLLGQQER
ncbi:non-homologous end-joining DNA ligase [Frankia sp. CNm7]|uniref:Non-homologous end-joining DNA ligase n=1 Tax=Frankia nepalensis TaxID=1836974 RepID=A0A937RJR1_9ACTN|nr:non-homologous end-joining DNA ligase [Frankia nepalensis]MBL7500827.1 non-homologous end-joining DNA ligase [Frankia nepalensis]MBL7515383.1 non-homologous end-joining DNA ligase [Frankia nepalensis]MBL7518311.1 non-homologous end-joining DNA ligase [Frankia nepalensis]MBL7631447.1 non-homologous end-joining DNA ligase [Frankia nepalensis]